MLLDDETSLAIPAIKYLSHSETGNRSKKAQLLHRVVYVFVLNSFLNYMVTCNIFEKKNL